MEDSDSEIYLAPSEILQIPRGTKTLNDPTITTTSTTGYNSSSSSHANNANDHKQQQQQQPRTTANNSVILTNNKSISTTTDTRLEAVYYKGSWFAVDDDRLDQCQSLEKSGRLSEVRVVKLNLYDLPEDVKLCLTENFNMDSNDYSESGLSDDEQFFTRGKKGGGYRHLTSRDNFESDLHARIEATLEDKSCSNTKGLQRYECSADEDESSSSEGDWSGNDNSSEDHGCRRICDDGCSASSDEDEECLLKD